MPTLRQIAQQTLAATPDPESRAPDKEAPLGTNPPLPRVGLGDHFDAGLEMGRQGMFSMGHGLRAIASQALGGDPTDALADMRLRDDEIQREVAGIKPFEEFVASPTLGGFLDQAALATGELVPSLATSVVTGGAGALAGGLAAVVGKQVIGRGARIAARELIKDELVKKARGEALDPDVEDVLELAYQGLRRTVGANRRDIAAGLAKEGRASAEIGRSLVRHARDQGATRGGAIGAALGEYPLNAGSLGAEAFEATGEEGPTRTQALGALATAGPLSAVGGIADVVVFKGLLKMAKRRADTGAPESGAILSTIQGATKGAGLAGMIEGGTEGIQEAAAVGFREAIDPGYVGDAGNKALLRIGEAAFKGAAGSIVPGAGGGAVARIIPKARNLIDKAQQGSFREDGTAPEPVADVAAQIGAIEDPSQGKESAYFSANTFETTMRSRNVDPELREAFREAQANPNENIVRGDTAYRAVDENGRTAIAASFIGDSGSAAAQERMGRLENFVQGPNDEAAQAAFLGHRAPIDEDSVILNVRDEDGSILHQAAVPSNLADVETSRFRREFPGGTVERGNPEDVLRERRERVTEQGDVGEDISRWENVPPQMRAASRKAWNALRRRNIDPEKATDEQLLSIKGIGQKTVDAFRTALASGEEFLRSVRPRQTPDTDTRQVPEIPQLPSPDGASGDVKAMRLDSIGIRSQSLPDAVDAIQNDEAGAVAENADLDGLTRQMAKVVHRDRAAAGMGPLLQQVIAPASIRQERDGILRDLAGRIKRSTRKETLWRLRRQFVEQERERRFDEAMDSGGAADIMQDRNLLRTGVRRMIAAQGGESSPAAENAVIQAVLGEEAAREDVADRDVAPVMDRPRDDTIDEADPNEDQPDMFGLGMEETVEGYASRSATGDEIVSEESWHNTEWAPEQVFKRGERPKPRVNGWRITAAEHSGVPEALQSQWASFLRSLSPAERSTFERHEPEMSEAMVRAILQGPPRGRGQRAADRSVSRNVGRYLFEVRRETDPVAGEEVLRLYRRSNREGASEEMAVERFFGRIENRLRRQSSRPNPQRPQTDSTLVAVTPEGEMLPLHRNALLNVARNGAHMNMVTRTGLLGEGLNDMQSLRSGFLRGWTELALRDWRFLTSEGQPWDPTARVADPPDLDGMKERMQGAFDRWQDAERRFRQENPQAREGQVAEAIGGLRSAYQNARNALSAANERVIAQRSGYAADDVRMTLPLARMANGGQLVTVHDLLVNTRDPFPTPDSRSAGEMQTENGLPLGDYLGLKQTADTETDARRNQAELKTWQDAERLVRTAMGEALLNAGWKQADIDAIANDTVLYDRNEPLRDGVMDALAEHIPDIRRELRKVADVESEAGDRAMQFLRSVRRAQGERDREHSGNTGAYFADNANVSWDAALSARIDAMTQADPRLKELLDRYGLFSNPRYAERIPTTTRRDYFQALDRAIREEVRRLQSRNAAEFTLRTATAPAALAPERARRLEEYRPIEKAERARWNVMSSMLAWNERVMAGRAEPDPERMRDYEARLADMDAHVRRVTEQVASAFHRSQPIQQFAEVDVDEAPSVREEDYLIRKYIRSVPGGEAAMNRWNKAQESLQRLLDEGDATPQQIRAAENEADAAVMALPSLARSIVSDFDKPRVGPLDRGYVDSVVPSYARERREDETPEQRTRRLRPHRISRLRSTVGSLGNEILALEGDVQELERRRGVPQDVIDEQRTGLRQKWDQIDRTANELDRLVVEETNDTARRTRQRRPGRIRAHNLGNQTAERVVQRFRAEIADRIDSDIHVVLASDVRGMANDIAEPGARDRLQRTLEAMEADPNNPGFIVFGKKSATIVLRDTDDKALQALALGHELGHVFWRGEIERLSNADGTLTDEGWQLWDQYREKIEDVGQYTDDAAGFEEWYADQVSAYLLNDPPSDLPSHIKAYFKRVADRLRNWLRSVGSFVLQDRFEPNAFAQRYVEDRMRDYRRSERTLNLRSMPTEDMRARKLTLDVGNAIDLRRMRDWRQSLDRAWQSGTMETLKHAFAPANAHLREMSPELARFFAARTGTGEATGFHDDVAHDKNRALFRVSDALEVKNPQKLSSWHSEDVMTALLRAEDNQVSTDDLADGTEAGRQAKALRVFLQDIYESYLPPELTGNLDSNVRFRQNYFPRKLSIEFLENSSIARASLQRLIEQHAPDEQTRRNARAIVTEIVGDGDVVDGIGIQGDGGFRPGMSARNTRSLAFIPTTALRDEGLVRPPLESLVGYIDQAVKTKQFHDRGGTPKVMELLEKVPVERRARAERNVRGQLGFLNIGISPGWRKFNAAAHALTAWTTLAFSVFGSVAEPMATMVRTNGTVKFGEFARQMVRTASEDENRELARAIGVVAPEAMETVMGSMDAINDVNPELQRSMSFFFRATGLSAITQYTRELAAGMGREFLLNAAKAPDTARNERYLSNLGVTAQEVIAWDAAGRPTSGRVARPVKDAIGRFVDESSVRPTPGSRPALGNDPRFRAIYALKTFSYDFGVRFVAGMGREVHHLYKAGNKGPAAQILLTAAALFLPVTMLALELREWLKWGVRSGLEGLGVDTDPNAVFTSDRMGGLEYAMEIMDRSGLLGPVSVAVGVGESFAMGRNPVVSEIPIADLVAEVLSGNYDRAVPVVSNAL